MTYVDGFVFSVPKKNVAVYKKMATEGGKAWKKFGAIVYLECKGDDLKLKPGMKASFAKMTKASKNDTVWFSFIVFKNKKHRDSVNAKVMKFFEKKYDKDTKMPFDMRKMAYGGFEAIVDL